LAENASFDVGLLIDKIRSTVLLKATTKKGKGREGSHKTLYFSYLGRIP